MNASANNNSILTNVNDSVNPIEWDFDEFAAVFDLGTSRWCWRTDKWRLQILPHLAYQIQTLEHQEGSLLRQWHRD